jgi:flagellar motor switch protein FliN
VNNVQPIQFLADAYATILSDSFALFGSRPNVSWIIDPSGAGADGETSALWWAQPFDLGKSDEVLIGAPEGVWSTLGSLIGGAAEGAAQSQRTHYLDFVRQTLSDLADAMSAVAQNPVRALRGREVDSPAELSLRLAIEVQFKDRLISPLWLGCTSGFLSSVHRVLTVDVANNAPNPAVDTSQAKSSVSKFDMLLDVEMPVSVSFGKATLPLKDVMKLAVGSIVELNRRPAEPVDVIVNNCIVARGEVVVVEGSYGLRLLEIVGEQERLSVR